MPQKLKEQLAEASADFLALALGDRTPPLSTFVTADGRVGRQMPHGLEWTAMLPEAQVQAVFALADQLLGGHNGAFVRDAEGHVLSAYKDSAGQGQVRVSLVATRRLGAEDFASALQNELFFFLQSLVSLGENVWIVGDTGVELDFGAAIVPDSHTLLVRPPADRPPPYRTAMLVGDVSLNEAVVSRDRGGFSTLVFDGGLGPTEVGILGERGGVVLCQRATSIERALRKTGLLERQDLAQQLPCIACVVTLQRSATLGAIVAQLGEFRRNEQGVDYITIAARGVLPDARMLAMLEQPESMQRLVEAGVEGVVLALAEAAPDDAMNIVETSAGPMLDDETDDFDDDEESFEVAPSDEDLEEESTFSEAEIGHKDPGWELDAAPARQTRSSGLVQAPGPDGKSGLFRARPVVRPSAPIEPEPEIGTLSLDAPQKKVIIPEAPSGAHQKRSFAEILRERHRFPPMSDKGPTLTPPVLDIGDDDGEDPDEDDITP